MASDRSLRDLMDFAAQIAYTAGRMTLGYFNTGVRPDYKQDDSPVTVADKLSEEYIRHEIEQRYPAHAIVGEEYGVKESAGASHRWLIDPIDGTRSFIRGVPLYGVLIGLEIDGAPSLGAAYYPATDEMLVAANGEGCYWNGKRARVSSVSELSRAYVSCSDFGNFEVYGLNEAWLRLIRRSYARVGWTDAFGYLLVATGRLEVMVDAVTNPWDCGPFAPILREAGGYFGDWRGNPTNYGGQGLATNSALKEQVIALLNGVGD
jgi:myo-inositol-1(or 4)-monophosphatase